VALDPRCNAWRADLADARLRGAVAAPRYVEGQQARVVVGRAPVRRFPSPETGLDTFYHYGEDVLVFAVAGGYAWCQSRFDRYVGYVEEGHLALGTPAEAGHFVATLGSYTYEAPDLRSAVIDFLPRHSAVVVAAPARTTRGTDYVGLDTGGFLPRACLSPEQPRSPSLVAAASLYLGVPYLWGGRSFLGIDCSGLVQCAFRDIGVAVPRDSDMQRDAIGDVVSAGAIADLRRGDLIYLPGHVLIYAGAGRVIHADGVSMTVRRDNLAAWLAARGLALDSLTIRRHKAAAD